MGLCKSSLPPLFTMSSTVRVEDLAPVYACKSWIPTNSRMHLGVPTPTAEGPSKWNTGPDVGSKEFSSYPDQIMHLVSFLSTKNCQPMWQTLAVEQLELGMRYNIFRYFGVAIGPFTYFLGSD